MSANEFMGMFIAAVIALIGLVTAIVTPMLKLNASIVSLNTTMQEVRKNDAKRDAAIQSNKEEINDLKFNVREHEHELANHETRIKSLEHKCEPHIGTIDNVDF